MNNPSLNRKELDRAAKFKSKLSDDPEDSTIARVDVPPNGRHPLPGYKGKNIHAKQNTDEHFYKLPRGLTREQRNDQRIKALYDYWAFIDLIEFKGGRNEFSKVHREMVSFVSQTQLLNTDKRRRLGLIPRGHLKSTLGTVSYTLWRIYRNPNIRICVATATKDLALQFVREIKQYLENEELQEKVWNNRPHWDGRMIPILDKAGYSRRNRKWDLGDYTQADDKKVVWRADALQVIRTNVMKEPTIIAASPGSTITGMHFDLMILDDIINDDTTATVDKIRKTLRWTQDLESIVDPPRTVKHGTVGKKELVELIGDEFVVWGTRYAKGDYYEYLIENLEDFEYTLMFRNVYINGEDNTDGYIWGERFNDQVIKRLKKRQGIIRFSSQYLNKVVVSEEVILNVTSIKYMLPAHIDLDYKAGWARISHPELAKLVDIKLHMVIDPAISQKKTADNSVIMVGGIDHEYNLYIVDFRSGKFLPDTLIRNTYELADKWRLNAAWVEVVAFQQALIYMFRSKFAEYRPLALREYRPKGDKKARIETHLQPIVYNQQMYLMSWMKGNTDLMEEFTYFPSDVAHDDHLDAMAMIVENAKPTPNGRGRNRTIYDHFRTNNRYGGRVR